MDNGFNLSPEVRRAIEMLAQGATPGQVMTATGATRDQVSSAQRLRKNPDNVHVMLAEIQEQLRTIRKQLNEFLGQPIDVIAARLIEIEKERQLRSE